MAAERKELMETGVYQESDEIIKTLDGQIMEATKAGGAN